MHANNTMMYFSNNKGLTVVGGQGQGQGRLKLYLIVLIVTYRCSFLFLNYSAAKKQVPGFYFGRIFVSTHQKDDFCSSCSY